MRQKDEDEVKLTLKFLNALLAAYYRGEIKLSEEELNRSLDSLNEASAYLLNRS